MWKGGGVWQSGRSGEGKRVVREREWGREKRGGGGGWGVVRERVPVAQFRNYNGLVSQIASN